MEGSIHAKNQPDSSSRFDTILACNRWTDRDRKMTTAYITLALCSKITAMAYNDMTKTSKHLTKCLPVSVLSTCWCNRTYQMQISSAASDRQHKPAAEGLHQVALQAHSVMDPLCTAQHTEHTPYACSRHQPLKVGNSALGRVPPAAQQFRTRITQSRAHENGCSSTTLRYQHITTTIILWPLDKTNCTGWHPQSKTGKFCWRWVLLPACPCWQQIAHSDYKEDDRVLLNGVTSPYLVYHYIRNQNINHIIKEDLKKLNDQNIASGIASIKRKQLLTTHMQHYLCHFRWGYCLDGHLFARLFVCKQH